MTTIHPTFYPDRSVWQTDDGRVAHTIRELLKQYPPKTQVQDYYVGACPAHITERHFSINDALRNHEMRPKIVTPPKPGGRQHIAALRHGRKGRRRFNYSIALDMWYYNLLNSRQIAERLGVGQQSVEAMLAIAAKKGDPRAVKFNDITRGTLTRTPSEWSLP